MAESPRPPRVGEVTIHFEVYPGSGPTCGTNRYMAVASDSTRITCQVCRDLAHIADPDDISRAACG